MYTDLCKPPASPSQHSTKTWVRLKMLLLSAALVSVPSTVAVAQPRVETFVIAVGGQSSCLTFSAPEPVRAFFGATGVFIPTDGIAVCNIAGEMRLTTDPNGPLSDSTSVDTVFNNGNNSFVGSASATAQYGKVIAEAHGTFGGPQNGGIVDGADGYSLFNESFIFASPSISAGDIGSVVFYFAIAGNLSAPQPGTAGAAAMYRQNTAGVTYLMIAQVDPRLGASLSPPSEGFTLTPTSISGSDVFHTFSLPITYGTPFDFTMGLLTYSLPALGGPIDADFTIGAQLTRIEAFDSHGQPVTDFVITSGSGTGYDANGVQLP